MAAAWGGCSLCSFPSRHHALKGACQGLWSCVGLRKSPLGLYLCLQIFITLWGPIVSGSGNGGGGPAVEFPETDSLKGKGIFSYLSPEGTFSTGWSILHSRAWAGNLGAFTAEASLGSQHFPWRIRSVVSHHFSFLVTGNSLQCCRSSSFGFVRETASRF